jgi:hypothetical protein
VDHVNDYKPPKDDDRYDDETRRLHEEGCAPKEQIPERFIKRETETSRKKSSFKDSPKRVDLKRVKKEDKTDLDKNDKVIE